MGRLALLSAVLSLQYLGSLGSDCPEFRKDVQWMKGEKGTLEGSQYHKTAESCQKWCQDFTSWNSWDDDGTQETPCVGWTFWASAGPYAPTSWCYLYDNSAWRLWQLGLHETGVASPGAVSGLKYDCSSVQGPNVLELLLEGLNQMRSKNGSLQLTSTNWKYIMADDTDIDQDGDISDREIEHKFGTYMADLFQVMDKSGDEIVTEQEIQSFGLDLPFLNKFLDAIFETYPVKPFLLASDSNRDGVWDENDLYLPENSAESLHNPPYLESSTSETDNSRNSGPGLRLRDSDKSYEGKVWINNGGVSEIGQNEGDVICRELGFKGLDRLRDEYAFRTFTRSRQKYVCNGTEDKLENCQKTTFRDRYTNGAMGVTCEEELGSLRLIGGKDSSSGDIFLGNRALGCVPYRRDEWSIKRAKVICRELGFPGVAKITRGAAFTKKFRPWPRTLNIENFECQGNEMRLTDCKIEKKVCHGWDGNVQGVVCSDTDGRAENADDIFLEDIIDWQYAWADFEVFERIVLSIADANKDGKLSLEEIKSKFAEYLAIAFQLVDQTGDGYVSIEDFTTLQMSVGPIHKVMDLVFDGRVQGIDLLQTLEYLNKEFRFKRFDHNWDLNNDTKFSADDLRGNREPSYILPLLSKKLDKNQDGKLQRDEVREFTDNIFKKLDKDGDGVLTFEDGFSLMEEYGESCISLLQWRSFLPKAMEAVKTQFRAMMSYVFKELDEDGNGEIDLKEFQGLYIPCAATRREVNADPSRIRCSRVFDHFFFRNREAFDFRMPPIPLIGRGRGGPMYDEDVLEESACKILS